MKCLSIAAVYTTSAVLDRRSLLARALFGEPRLVRTELAASKISIDNLARDLGRYRGVLITDQDTSTIPRTRSVGRAHGLRKRCRYRGLPRSPHATRAAASSIAELCWSRMDVAL